MNEPTPEHWVAASRLSFPDEYVVAPLAEVDPEIDRVLWRELERQRNALEMIASENFVPRAVLEAVGSVLTNEYAGGYSGKRYYGGCREMDVVKQLAVNRNAIPFDERPPMNPSGLRIGTPALTTRGMVEEDMREIGRAIAVAFGDSFESGRESLPERSRALMERLSPFERPATPMNVGLQI